MSGRLIALAALFASVATVAPEQPASAADAGPFTKHAFTNSRGTLPYRVYTPPGRSQPTDLVVVLPPAGSTAAIAAQKSRWNVVAKKLNFVVVYPQQNRVYNSNLEWDWAKASREGRTNREASLIAGITRTVVDRYDLDPRRVYVMGFSAGAGMASAMAVTFPDIYSGLGLEAGCPFDNVGCAGSSVTADQSAAAVVKAMGRYHRELPVFNEYGNLDPIALGTSGGQVVPSWLTVDDMLDDGHDNGSVSRQAANSTTVVPALPYKPYTATQFRDHRGCLLAENWVVYGEQHAWSGGAQTDPSQTDSDPLAPDATAAMYRFWTSPHTLGRATHC